MTTVVGWDLSLTGTGVARISTTPGYLSALGEVSDTEPRVTLSRIASTGKKGATLPERHERLVRLRNTIMDTTFRGGPPDLILVEAPSFASSGAGTWDRAGLWWLCMVAAQQQRTPIVEVPPSTLKKWATDKGNADKAAMIAALVRMWPDATIRSSDEADALALASIGAIHLRVPVPFTVLERHRTAVGKLPLPDRPERTA